MPIHHARKQPNSNCLLDSKNRVRILKVSGIRLEGKLLSQIRWLVPRSHIAPRSLGTEGG